ncbi:hypothetical protein DERP_009850 [Dermatophagoides pteronyssinus]|uniref:Secreted protein n=1 Tax=Dermatophagoides pteronyssinus TaxID=6956 RepID=A0ABQ8IRB3_DERPT|nr:hypothetical protein DERP_009850 [Dermatophagoides pteronyssinus]
MCVAYRFLQLSLLLLLLLGEKKESIQNQESRRIEFVILNSLAVSGSGSNQNCGSGMHNKKFYLFN